MTLGRVHLVALLAPLAVFLIALAWWFGMGWVKPGASINERGYEEVLYSALFGAMVEAVAVPVAAVRMWRTPALRTRGNFAATVTGVILIPACALIWLAMLLAL